MASRVQIVISVDASQAQAAVGQVRSAISGLGGTVVTTTQQGSQGFGAFEGSILKAMVGANLLTRALDAAASGIKTAIADSTLLAARSEVLDRVMVQLAGSAGKNIDVLRAQVEELRSLGIEQTKARQSIIQFMAAELDTADAIRIANVARDRAVIAGENTSDTMERLTRAILAQETELLKQVGIVIRQEDAFKRYGAQIGKSANDLNEFERRQAFVNEILRFGEGSLGAYESAMEKVGKQLTSLPRFATEAAIAFGSGFQRELQIGVTALTESLQFVQENGRELASLAKAVGLVVIAYGAWQIATSEVALAHVGLGLAKLIASFGGLADAITTIRLLLMGAGGTVGLVGAWGLLAVAAGALGAAVGELSGRFLANREMAKVAAFDVEGWRKRLEEAGVTVRDNAQAMTILQRVSDANNKLRAAGLPTLQISADLLTQLEQAEKRLAKATGEGTVNLERQAAALERFNDIVRQRERGVAGSDPLAKIAFDLEDRIRQIQKLGKEAGKSAADVNREIALQIQEAVRQSDAVSSEQLRKAAESLDQITAATKTGIDKVIAERDRELEAAREKFGQIEELRDQLAAFEVARTEQAEREITELLKREFLEREKAAIELAEKRREILDEIVKLERQNALDSASPLQRIELERIQRLKEFEARLGKAVEDRILSQEEALEQLRRAEEAINRQAGIAITRENERIFDEQARLIERNAQQFELFWDRVTRGAKSTGDFLRNLWNELANQFRRFVLQSVAQWIFGQRQIAASSGATAAGVGGFAGLLGAIFGTPGIASARTPPFVSSLLPGGGAAAAGGVPGVFGGAGSATSGIPLGIPGLGSAGLPGLFGSAGASPAGVPAVLGLLLGLEGASRGRPGLAAGLGIGGVLGGVALSGAAAGIAGGIGGLAGAGVGLAGFLTNPWGLLALAGIAGVSALIGVIQRGRKKEQASDIANQGFAEIREAVEAFEKHSATYEATISQLNRIWGQMEAAWRQIGGSVGSNSIRDQRRYFDDAVRQVDAIQKERERRGVLISNLPLPQFASGGFVGPLGGMVHPGEYVIRREIVQQTGVPYLQRLNQGAPAAGDSYHIEIHTPDKSGVEEMIRGNFELFKRAITAMIRQSRGEFGLR